MPNQGTEAGKGPVRQKCMFPICRYFQMVVIVQDPGGFSPRKEPGLDVKVTIDMLDYISKRGYDVPALILSNKRNKFKPKKL